jgi:hypothetical protein
MDLKTLSIDRVDLNNSHMQ